MELGRGSIVFGTLIAVGLGAAAAWWTRPDPGAPAKAPAAAAGTQQREATNEAPKAVALYKWQDDSGVWNYTDKPPPGGRAYEEVRGTPNVTSVPTVVPEVPVSRQSPSDIPPPPSD